MGLCWLGALRGLCGFCVHERLGGLEACGVFALVFRFFSVFAPVFVLLSCLLSLLLSFWLSFSLFAPVVFCLSSCLVFPALSLWFLFPFRTIRKKKGRKVFLRPLLSCCVVVYKALNITVITCGSSFPCRFPLHMIPAISSGRFVGSFTVCPSLSMVEYFQ